MIASHRVLPLLKAALIILMLWAAGNPLAAQTSNQLPSNWNDAVHTLAGKIYEALDASRTISIEVDNISSLRVTDAAGIKQELESDLGRRGIRTSSDAAAEVQIKLTLSEGVEGYVWVAEIRKGEALQVAIVSASKSANGGTASIPSMSVQRNVLWVQAEKMLDFTVRPFLNGNSTVETALLPDRIIVYEAGSEESRGPISLSALSNIQPSRDLRGQLMESSDHQLKPYVANSTCTSGGGAGFFCGEQLAGGWPFPDGWAAKFVAGRNYFNGFTDLNDKSKQARFFSAATVSVTDGGFSRILTGLDGKARWYVDSRNPSAIFEGWGDDIATIRPGCDHGWQVLVTGTGDWTQSDQIQLYEISGQQAVAIGQPLEFPGPILSLWPSADNKSARVVSRNMKTGMYEASIVSVTCGN